MRKTRIEYPLGKLSDRAIVEVTVVEKGRVSIAWREESKESGVHPVETSEWKDEENEREEGRHTRCDLNEVQEERRWVVPRAVSCLGVKGNETVRTR